MKIHKLLFKGLAVLTVLLVVKSCQNPKITEIKTIIDSLSKQWVPDSREGITQIDFTFSKNNITLKGETDCNDLKNELVNVLKSKGYQVIDSLAVLPSETLGNNIYGIVSPSVINLRAIPSHSSEMTSQALMGMPVKILKSSGSWYLIQTPDKYIAWTEKNSIQAMTFEDLEKWKNVSKITCTDNSGWIYEIPEEKGVVGDFVAGCIMENLGAFRSHQKVALPDGRTGYIKNNVFENYSDWKNKPEPTGDEIIKTAASVMGIPYLWGGTSSKGADCSGFVQNIYFRNGIILGRDASLQALHGLDVDISNGWNQLQKGDLLFFGTIRDSKPRVTHVAIYIEDGDYIHASGRVMINSLNPAKPYFSESRTTSLLLAKRIIGYSSNAGIVAVKNHQFYN
jgi:hypothetical protein